MTQTKTPTLTTGLFELFFDATPDPWFLGDPEPSIDSWPFRRGERIEVPDELWLPVSRPGRTLEVTFRGGGGGGIIVVTQRIGALIETLAPEDVQRIPARVEGTDERYELLHVLSRIDCVDWEQTRAQARREGETRSETGTLASLAPLIDRARLHRHVMSYDMTLNTEGIVGPRIFRVVDWDLYPVVTQELKAALEHEGATGLEFQPRLTSGDC